MKNEEKEIKKEELADKEIETVSGGGFHFTMKPDLTLSDSPTQSKLEQRKCKYLGCGKPFTPKKNTDQYCDKHASFNER